MNDQEKCRLIAEFEGFGTGDFEVAFNAKCDYTHDLNATMRAARKLPHHLDFSIALRRGGADAIISDLTPMNRVILARSQDETAARAAFEALVAWLMERTK